MQERLNSYSRDAFIVFFTFISNLTSSKKTLKHKQPNSNNWYLTVESKDPYWILIQEIIHNMKINVLTIRYGKVNLSN